MALKCTPSLWARHLRTGEFGRVVELQQRGPCLRIESGVETSTQHGAAVVEIPRMVRRLLEPSWRLADIWPVRAREVQAIEVDGRYIQFYEAEELVRVVWTASECVVEALDIESRKEEAAAWTQRHVQTIQTARSCTRL